MSGKQFPPSPDLPKTHPGGSAKPSQSQIHIQVAGVGAKSPYCPLAALILLLFHNLNPKFSPAGSQVHFSAALFLEATRAEIMFRDL